MKCPSCNGDGGWYDPIFWKGIGGGPYEEDKYCAGTGEVPVAAWLSWHITVWWDEQIRRRWSKWENRKIIKENRKRI